MLEAAHHVAAARENQDWPALARALDMLREVEYTAHTALETTERS